MVNESAVVVFDDERAVANAGVMLPALMAQRHGLERLVDDCVDLGDRPGAANPGRKVMTMCSAMVLGADCIDDCDVLRSGQTGAVLGHRIAAPSTLGTFLRAFTFGHVRQLDRVLGLALERAWAAGAGPGHERLVIDVDSFVGEVHGYKKQGAGYGYTRQLGYHPLLATRADTGEVLHIRLRKGSANTSRGMLRFCEELIARVDRAGATGPKLLRTDSGFWAKKTFVRLDRAGWQFSIGIRMQPHIRALVDAIPEDAWVTLEDYPKTSIAQIAETTLGDFRMIVRRVRTLSQQGELLPSWEHYPFATNRTDDLSIVEAEHRQHAVVELAIRDLKDQALAHFPSGKYHANADWTVIAALAHNLLRWTQKTAPPRRHDQDRPNAPPPAADDPRPPRPNRPPHAAADARPLALATRLPHRPTPNPGTAATRLNAPATDDDQQQQGRPRPTRNRPNSPHREGLKPARPAHAVLKARSNTRDRAPTLPTRPLTRRPRSNGGSRLRKLAGQPAAVDSDRHARQASAMTRGRSRGVMSSVLCCVLLLLVAAPATRADRRATGSQAAGIKAALLRTCSLSQGACRWIGGARVSSVDARYGFGEAGGDSYDGSGFVRRTSRSASKWTTLAVQGGGAEDCRYWRSHGVPLRVLRDFRWKDQLTGKPC